MSWAAPLFIAALTPLASAQVASTAHGPELNFESGPVRQLLVADDGLHLYLLNTRDHRLETYTIEEVPGPNSTEPKLTLVGSLFTGLEPVSMAIHPQDPNLMFVANLVSDSLTLVDLEEQMVLATYRVGDEPRDVEIVGGRIYVACARARDLNGAWVDHALVVLDLAPTPAVSQVHSIEGHKPRALATNGSHVFVVPQNSGNHTTILRDDHAFQLGLEQIDLDAFDTNINLNKTLLLSRSGPVERGWRIPQTGRIVFDHEYPGYVQPLADRDVRAASVATGALDPSFSTGVGTTLFDVQVNPVTGALWVANTDANNRTRMEYNVAGDAVTNQVTVVEGAPGGAVLSTVELAPPFTAKEHAQPHAITFYSGAAGDYGYVAALGTRTVLVLDAATAGLVAEIDVPDLPGGLAVDTVHDWLFVYSRADKVITAYDIASGHAPVGTTVPAGYDAETPAQADGRRALYDADPGHGGGNGAMSCATCHVFADNDQLGWDLGNSAGAIGYAWPPSLGDPASGFSGQLVTSFATPQHSPMKGPMVTQSLRGLRDGEPFHWRGDRPFLHNFQPAFAGLNGGTGLSEEDMQEVSTFLDSVVWPPNPYQPKGRVYTGALFNAVKDFGMPPFPGKPYKNAANPLSCNHCHSADMIGGTNFTGTDALLHEARIFQVFNAATLRGLYEKQYKRVTGFGARHDGSSDGAFGFLTTNFFSIDQFELLTTAERQRLADLVNSWDSGLSPMVGAQITMDAQVGQQFVDFMTEARRQSLPAQGWVDLIGHGWREIGGQKVANSMIYTADPAGGYSFLIDDGTRVTVQQMRGMALNGKAEVVFTCVPPGTGMRLSVDRDEDGLLDAEEIQVHGTLPNDPDTDDDGYDDAAELAYGGNPLVPDAQLPDGTPPSLAIPVVRGVFTSSATVEVMSDEPTTVEITLTTAGGGSHGPFVSSELRRRHHVVLTGLPAGTDYLMSVVATDRSGNSSTTAGSFTTVVPHIRVRSMDLQKQPTGPGTIQLVATVVVEDRTGAPIAGVPVHGIFAGDIGNLQRTFTVTTDPTGDGYLHGAVLHAGRPE